MMLWRLDPDSGVWLEQVSHDDVIGNDVIGNDVIGIDVMGNYVMECHFPGSCGRSGRQHSRSVRGSI